MLHFIHNFSYKTKLVHIFGQVTFFMPEIEVSCVFLQVNNERNKMTYSVNVADVHQKWGQLSVLHLFSIFVTLMKGIFVLDQ